MAHLDTLMGQLLQLIPRHVFDHVVDSQAGQGPQPRKFSHWSQLGAMLYAQWSGRRSLRDLIFGLNQQTHKLYHLGCTEVKRATLADANEQRPAVIFEKTYHRLLVPGLIRCLRAISADTRSTSWAIASRPPSSSLLPSFPGGAFCP